MVECKPLKTWEELYLWTTEDVPLRARKVKPLASRSPAISGKEIYKLLLNEGLDNHDSSEIRNPPKTLVCHDLMGGYMEGKQSYVSYSRMIQV